MSIQGGRPDYSADRRPCEPLATRRIKTSQREPHLPFLYRFTYLGVGAGERLWCECQRQEILRQGKEALTNGPSVHDVYTSRLQLLSNTINDKDAGMYARVNRPNLIYLMNTQADQAVEVAGWNVKVRLYADRDMGTPPGKTGNTITRMWVKTGSHNMHTYTLMHAHMYTQYTHNISYQHTCTHTNIPLSPFLANNSQLIRLVSVKKELRVVGTGASIGRKAQRHRGDRASASLSAWQERRHQHRVLLLQDVGTEGRRYPQGRLRLFQQQFFALGQKEQAAWKAKPAKGTRRSSLPNTAFGKALTVGAQLDSIKQYEDEQAEKAAAKLQRADVKLARSQ